MSRGVDVVSQILPKIPYLTILDKYLLVTNICIVLVIVQQGMFARLHTHMEHVVLVETDIIFLIVNTILWAFVNLYFHIYTQFLSCLKNSER